MNKVKKIFLLEQLTKVRDGLAKAIEDKFEGSEELFSLRVGMAYIDLRHIIEDFEIEYSFEDED